MERKEIESIIKLYFDRLKTLLGLIEKDFNPEAIHKFRVQVKKIRAFLRLLDNELQGSGHLKLPKKLKALYLFAGKVRDMQLYLTTLNNEFPGSDKPDEYLALLERELKGYKKELLHAGNKTLLSKTEEIITGKLPHQLSQENIKRFLQQKEAFANLLLSSVTATDEDLHLARKNIKDVLYLVKILKEEADHSVIDLMFPDNTVTKAEKLAAQLGLFIDFCTAVSFIKPAWLNEINKREQEQLQILKKKWQSEIHSIKAELQAGSETLVFNNTG
jgi:CHAD domain-containing protein